MQFKKTFTAFVLAGLFESGAAGAQQYDRGYDPVYDQGGYGVATLEERVSKLEKQASGKTLVEMSNRMEQLKAEVLKLRGQVEELSHALDTVRQQQKDMYTDLDQRLRNAAPPVAAGAETAGAIPGTAEGVPPAGAAPAPPPPPDPAVRKADYEKAFNTLKDGNYPLAISQFKNFIATYPNGDYVDNAHYWLAEAHYVNRDFPAARDAFNKVIADFPQSSKVSDAQLKLGFIEYEIGQYPKAREILTDVIKRYPNTSAAKMAEKRLDKMRQDKR